MGEGEPVSLSPGTRVGPYEIVAGLGAGGMGEVYRAKDTRLQREVAVKVLAAGVADPERLRRFETEARAAGALSHPAVLALYDVGTHEGAPYIVSELLEGETLRDKLREGAMPVRRALELSFQLAHGLAAAHEKGVIHRDLKPENLFVTRDGRIKILDFGIAKLRVNGDGAAPQTLTNGTATGALLGTPGYMAPEQVRGKPADHRSDIFAFGAILHEMLSGRRAFHKDTPVETGYAILNDEAPPLPAGVPPVVERVARRCLEKAPEDRFQSARDLAFALEAVSVTTGPTLAGAMPAPPRRRWKRPWLYVALGLGLIVVLANLRDHEERADPTFHRLTFRRGVVDEARFAPDGRTVLYSASFDTKLPELYSAHPDRPESRALGLVRASLAAVARNGEMLIVQYPDDDAKGDVKPVLSQAPMDGGAPRPLLEDVQIADWAPDGTYAVARFTGGRTRIEYPAGEVVYETAGVVRSLRVSPDGEDVAFVEWGASGDDAGVVKRVGRAGDVEDLTERWGSVEGVAWAPDGHEVWFTAGLESDRALRAVSLRGRLRVVSRFPGRWVLRDIAPDGRVLIADDEIRSGIMVSPAGEHGEKDLSWFDGSVAADISADGQTVLFREGSEPAYRGGDWATYLRKTDGSPAVRLGDGFACSLSRDGKWALTIRGRGTPEAQIVLLPTGPGVPRPLPRDHVSPNMAFFMPKGDEIVVVGIEEGRGYRVFVRALSGEPSRPLLPEALRIYGAAFSSKGDRVAIGLPEGVDVYPTRGDAFEPRGLGGGEPFDGPLRWSEDDEWLYVLRKRKDDRGPLIVDRIRVADGERNRVFTIEPPPSYWAKGLRIAPTPHGIGYVYSYMEGRSELFLVDGLQ
jgi:hypothetical protein